MLRPEQRDTILSRIKEVAGTGETVTVITLIDRWYGEHQSSNWQECLDYLVEEGELVHDGDKYSKRRSIMEEVKKVYKALQETPEGKLISLRAQAGECICLDYKEGEITYAPEDSIGIFTDATIDKAKDNAIGNMGHAKANGGAVVVCEAIPLGNVMRKPMDWDPFLSYDRYPAILLGKEVWREKPKEEPRPEPKFSVGQRVLAIEGYYKGGTFSIARVEWGMKEFGSLHYHYYMDVSEMLPIDEGYLELAPPEPEWVDVTEECEIILRHFSSDEKATRGFWIELSHDGEWLMELGLEKTRLAHNSCYKIEDLGTSFGDSNHQFRVLKKA